jgi:crotonobetainyl-CoA:carnitine CoA-transferase CaiB-like acyl-CoA transferase
MDEFEAIYFYPWLLERTKEEVLAAALKAKVYCGPVFTSEDLINSPHLKDRAYFVQAEHPAAGTLTYPGAPFKMHESPWAIRRPAPLLGQHNEEIYRGELGYNQDDFDSLRRAGII